MKRRILVKQIEDAGCVLLRRGSRHDIYHNPITGHSEPLPRHREINEKGLSPKNRGQLYLSP